MKWEHLAGKGVIDHGNFTKVVEFKLLIYSRDLYSLLHIFKILLSLNLFYYFLLCGSFAFLIGQIHPSFPLGFLPLLSCLAVLPSTPLKLHKYSSVLTVYLCALTFKYSLHLEFIFYDSYEV